MRNDKKVNCDTVSRGGHTEGHPGELLSFMFPLEEVGGGQRRVRQKAKLGFAVHPTLLSME